MNHNLTGNYKRSSAFASKGGPYSVFGLLRTGIRRPASGIWRPSSGCRLSSVVRRPFSGFTLVELLVVIVIIAVLMSITIPVSKYAIRRAMEARQEVMLAKIRTALDEYRAIYGEYPITPITNRVPTTQEDQEARKHYWDGVIPDKDQTNSVTLSEFTNVNLSRSAVEHLHTFTYKDNDAGYTTNYFVDYSLTFPLMRRQEIEGKKPFYKFDKVTVMIQMNAYNEERDKKTGRGWRRRKSGGYFLSTWFYGESDAVNRYKAIDPVSGRQWKYTCLDGVSYALTTNDFY